MHYTVLLMGTEERYGSFVTETEVSLFFERRGWRKVCPISWELVLPEGRRLAALQPKSLASFIDKDYLPQGKASAPQEDLVANFITDSFSGL